MDIERISEKYQLATHEIAVLHYINQHKNQSTINIRDVAKATFTSPASIITMCKKMGFSGYSELLYYIIGSKNLTFTLHKNDVVKQYGQSFYTLIKKHQHNNIMILSSGISTNIANYMADYFNLNGFRATTNSHLQLLRENQDTLLIIVSNSGETKRLVELHHTAISNKIDSIVFVGNKESRLANQATLTISSETNSAYSYQEYYPQLFFGTSLNTFELLMSYTLSQ